jgi:hypothetical protein
MREVREFEINFEMEKKISQIKRGTRGIFFLIL